jgi:capsular exopolysaccharide synthesis family protein
LELVDYLRIFRRRWPLVVALALIGSVVAWVTTPEADGPSVQLFEATHTLIVNPQATESTRNLAQTALLVTKGEVPQRVAAKLGGQPAVTLARQVTAEAVPEVGTVTVKSVQADPQRAELLANTFAEELIGYLIDDTRTKQSEAAGEAFRRVDDIQDQLRSLDGEIARANGAQRETLLAQRDGLVNNLRLAYDEVAALRGNSAVQPLLQTLEPASALPVADSGFSPPGSPLGRALLAGVVGLLVGAGLALVIEKLDTRIRTREQAQEAFALPVVAEVPVLPRGRRHRNEILSLKRPASPFAEAYRVLRTVLLLSRPGTPGVDETFRVFLLTSPGPSEGKTTSVAHLAAAFAEAGRSVLVLSCDFRRPRISKLFGVADQQGITDVLSGRPGAPTLADVVQPTNVRGVSVITSGTPAQNPAELLAGARAFIDATRSLADIVLIDTAPMLAANDASELVPEVDAVLVTVRSGKTPRESAQRAAELLRRVGAPVLGAVLIGAPRISSGHPYYYRYYLQNEGVLGWRRWLRRTPPLLEPEVSPAPPAPVVGDGEQPARPHEPAPSGRVTKRIEEMRVEDLPAGFPYRAETPTPTTNGGNEQRAAQPAREGGSRSGRSGLLGRLRKL